MQKLTDFINPQETKTKLAQLRSLKNSFKRNVILPTDNLRQSQAKCQCTNLQQKQDQCKLTNHNFRSSDLCRLFQHLYSKETMSVSDRNLIKRILLTTFEQDLIVATGKNIIEASSFRSMKKNEKSNMENHFYLLIKGKIKVKSKYYCKTYENGQYFGHIQLLSYSGDDNLLSENNNYNQIQALTDSFMIIINEQTFKANIHTYLMAKIQTKSQIFPSIFTNSMEYIRTLLLYEQMSTNQYQIGQKIVRKGEAISEFIFIYEGNANYQFDQKINSVQRKLGLNQCIGLPEYFLQQKQYLSNVYALDKCKAFVLTAQMLQKFVRLSIIDQIRDNIRVASNISSLQKQKKKQKQQPLKAKNFMRIRKVQLSIPKQFKTLASQTRENSTLRESDIKYMADFMFVTKDDTKRYDKQKLKHKKLRNNYSMVNERSINSSPRILYTFPEDF